MGGHKVKEIPIFFSFDNNYVIPAAVAFHSLLKKAKDGVCYKMYVLHTDINDCNKNLLLDIVSKSTQATLEFRDTNGFLQKNWENGTFGGKENKQFTANAIVKCFAARFFPEYTKIVYSDVDVVFMDDVSELIDVNLDGKYIAAVKNVFMKWDKNELGHLSPEHYEKLKDTYFAGGIWVLNLEKIRSDNIEDEIYQLISDDTIVKFWPDQDIMNIVCKNLVEHISLRYISLPYLLDRICKDDFVSHFSMDECIESIIYPKILHYAAIKPWNDEPKRKEVWWKVFAELNIPATDAVFLKKKRKLKLIDKARYYIWQSLDSKLRKKGILGHKSDPL